MVEPLKEFYAVTTTSVYHVTSSGLVAASAMKIALRGESKISVGQNLATGGLMLSVGKWLQAYIPEKYGWMHPMTAEERRLEQVSSQWWRGCSSNIIALFKDKGSAMTCFGASDQKPCDPRWLDSTQQVLAEIGNDHPSFYLPSVPRLSLLTPQKAA